MFFAKRSVLSGAINLVDMDRLGITAKPAMVGFDLINQIGPFVVVVPATSIDKRKTIDLANRQLGAKLRLATRLASLDGTDVWLQDADNPIVDPF